MTNLRIVNVQVIDSTDITVTFTESLTLNLITANVSILSASANVPNSQVLEIGVSQGAMKLVCQPLTPLADYYLQFQSVPQYPFESINGDAVLPMDGVSNRYLITGPLSSDNPVLNYLGTFYNGSIYDAMQNPNSVVSKYINSLAINLSRALYDIAQLKNENYLELDIIDEPHTRGPGPFDQLLQGAAYEVSRVGLGPTDATAGTVFQFVNFPDYPVTLQRQIVNELLSPNSIDLPGIFNINSLILDLSQSPVTRLDSLVFTQATANPTYVYNIPDLGYQIQSSYYDQDYGFSYAALATNQIKLSDKILADPLFSLENVLHVTAQYEYKNQGIIVDPTSLIITTVLQSVREVLPPIINIFNLQHAPITNASGNVSVSGGVSFLDPNQATPGALHPAFITEIPFRLNALPSTPGTYSINYSLGTVYVYGATITNDGTGPSPPLATYNYLFTYQSEQDYVYDSDASNLVALPPGNLTENAANVAFNYEQVLIPGVDYVADVHIESLFENVNNNLSALNVLTTQNSPITNVFQIFNETTGEIYTLSRWENNQVYFKYTNPPNIVSLVGERATFNQITNELLFVHTTISNASGLRIFQLFLANNSLVAATEDTVASSFNTSLTFADGNVFVIERWFSREFDATTNINRLLNVGEYMVDYANGVVYVAVSSTQSQDISTIVYRNSQIDPQFPHIISVDDLYYRISPLLPKNAEFPYVSFADGEIIPSPLNPSDELYLNNNVGAPYQILNGQVGAFVGSGFVPGVTYQVKYVRSVFEYDDLLSSTHPLNFVNSSSSSGFNITVAPLTGQIYDTVQFDGTNYYVLLNQNISFISPNITYSFNITRTSDGAQLWNSSGTIVPGNPVKLILPGINSPHTGDTVSIIYTFTINNISRVVVDYNKGDYFVDYTYVADEILISYEYGNNVLDFRGSEVLSPNDQYYVSYKAGALRDALLQNFGTLVNIPLLANVDLNFDRQRYREGLQAAMSSFVQGPTIPAMKNIGNIISHIEPTIVESAFQSWTLGTGLLNPQPIKTTGSFQLLPAQYGNGALINTPGQTISFPANSNLRLEEGTFETWISPTWNGLDNNSTLTFSILQDGYVINPGEVFIGAAEYHPAIVNGTFSVSKLTDTLGIPNTNKDGIFIYYDEDPSGNFYRWYFRVIDGYVEPSHLSSAYKIVIKTTGTIYNNQGLADGYITSPNPAGLSFFTGVNSITINIADGYGGIDQGVTFLSDPDQYILDFGKSVSQSRLSIYKDASGYMNFRVIDKRKNVYIISADVSSWQAGQLHMVAASWKLNTRQDQDEMHLFIDGFEVPNIIKYGQALQPYLSENFRTVDPEELLGPLTRDIVGSDDLTTTAGSNVVTSSINFSAFQIFIGDPIFINEVGFSSTGYIIDNINGQTLTLNANMPLSLPGDGRYSVNQTNFFVTSEINVVPNITVSTIHLGVETELPGVHALQPDYAISQDNNFNNILTIYNGVFAGDPILLRTLGLNFQDVTKQYYVWSTGVENILMTQLPPPISLDQANITEIILPNVAIGPANSTLVSGIFISNPLPGAHPSNSQAGRTLSVVLSGTNVDFSVPVNQVTINGDSGFITITETISFTDYGTLNFANRYISVNYIQIDVKPLNPLKAAAAVEVREKYPLTFSEASGLVPVVRYSYSIGSGYTLFNDSTTSVRDNNNSFSGLDIGNYLLIQSPGVVDGYCVAGFYLITGISADLHSLFIQPTNTSGSFPLPNFTNGVYQILNVQAARSGLQNGFFTLEASLMPGQPYFLNNATYELDYATYATIKFDPINQPCYLGTDLNGNNPINAILNQVVLYSIMLTDTRVGETIPANQRSITKDFNALKPFQGNSTTLMILSLNTFPFTNSAPFYATRTTDVRHFQSNFAVNDNFEQSIVILDKPILVPNTGILNTRTQGTVEFWMSTLFDTANDPNNRYYFDAYGAVVENTTSVNDVSVKLSGPANQILSVKLQVGDEGIDYFAGGKLEIDTQRAIQEETVSENSNTVVVSQPILQVITVKIVGDATGTDYFGNGAIGTDGSTIYLSRTLPQPNLPLIITYQSTNNNDTTLNTQVVRLNRKLPSQNTPVIVNYIPQGLQGDRIRIFKDTFGYMNFIITASGTDFVLRAPTRWARDTWHRVKASYIINSGAGTDEMRLFLDGYEWNDFRSGAGIVGPFPLVFGGAFPGDGYSDGYSNTAFSSISFKDPINDLFIGTDYTGSNPIFTLLDNFRISNISRPIYAPYGEPLDVNYTSNLGVALPVTKDLYTTYLMNFDTMTALNAQFATLKNRNTGQYDFTITIDDSFDIVSSSLLVQQNLENLINILKPANSRAFIQYIGSSLQAANT